MARRPAVVRWFGAVLITAFTTVVLWERLGHPVQEVAWAEDSGQFLEDRLAFGPFRTIWRPYAGYLHLLPRLLVDMSVALRPIDEYATTVNALSCLCVGVISGLVFVLSRRHVTSWAMRVLLAAVPAITPLGPVEIAGNTANLHWYLLFLAPWLFAFRPRSWWSAAAIAVGAGIATCTEIQTAVFLPLFLLNRRERRVLPVAAIALAGVAAQSATALTHPRPMGHGSDAPLDMMLGYFAQPIAGSWDANVRAVGTAIHAYGWWIVVVPGLLLLAAIAVGTLQARGTERWMLISSVGGSVVAWFAALTLNAGANQNWSTFTLAQFREVGPSRYAAAASMFLLAGVVIAADSLIARGTATLSAIGVVLIVAVLVAGAVNLQVSHRRDGGPVWATQVDAARPECLAHPHATIEVWAAPVLPRWRASIPCALVNA